MKCLSERATLVLTVLLAACGEVQSSTPPPSTGSAAEVKAAVLFGTCVTDDRPQRVLSALHYGRPAGAPYGLRAADIGCLAGETGCAGVQRCIGRGAPVRDAACDGRSEAVCGASGLEICSGGMRLTDDCSRRGQVCRDGACLSASASTIACSEESFTPRCDGGAPIYCHAGVEHAGPRCGDFGLACGAPVAGVAFTACAGSDGACSATSAEVTGWSALSAPSCAGGELTYCANGGRARIACTDLGAGFSCQTAAGTSFCGLASECDPTARKATCDGTVLVLCNAGKLERADCATHGFTGCNAGLGACATGG